MPNLAGFDLIIECTRVAMERELLNTPLVTGPNGGPDNDTLVPPFMLSRNVPLPGVSGLLSLKVTDLRLHAQPGSALLTLSLAFEQGSIIAPGIAVAMLGGQGTLTAPMYFTPPVLKAPPPGPQAAPPALPVSDLVLDFTQATSNLQLDQPSSTRLDQEVGPDLGAAIRSALSTALNYLFKKQGKRELGFSFAVDAVRDSTDMMVLSAVPAVKWIDHETLGIFGYHCHAANSGSMAWKHDSDLPLAPNVGAPWYPIAVLVSPSSFQQLVACPAVRGAARDHISGRHRSNFINAERNHNHNEGDATPGEIAAADQHLVQFLDGPQGQAEIVGATPAPCGHGEIDQRIDLPDPFSHTIGYVDRLSMDLGEGQIDVRAHARAKVFCGKVSVDVPMSLQPFIGADNVIQPGPIKKGEPSSDPDATLLCKVAIVAMSAFLIGPLIGSVIAVIGITVAESLAEGLINKEILDQDLPAPQIGGDAPDLPPGVRLRELFVAPSGLTILGWWDGMVNDPHKFNPAVRLFWESSYQESQNILVLPGTFLASCGGEPRTFHFTPRAWDTTVAFTLDIGDVPQPLHFDDWWLWHDGVAHRLAPGILTLAGRVVVPMPPDKEMLQHRDEIIIGVAGSKEQGYTLSFRAEDSNVPYQIEARVVDGSGRSWPLGTNHQQSKGMSFNFDQEYLDFREECARFMNEVVNSYQLVQEVPVWDQVMTFEHILHAQLRGVTQDRVMGAAATVRQLMIDKPEIAEQLFQQG